MRQETYKFEGYLYERINARTAAKLFNDGRPVALLAYNLKPGPWVHPGHVTNADGATLEKWVNTYSFYNCNTVAGRKVKFFRITKI